MSYMRDADGVRLDSIRVDAELARGTYNPNRGYTGPVATDTPTVTTGVAADAAFNKAYAVSGSTLPTDWPVDAFGKMVAGSNVWNSQTSVPAIGTATTLRFMSDGSEVLVFLLATNVTGDLFIGGR